MLTLWYWIVAAMLTAYVVLDGLDLGAGALHPAIAKTAEERRRVLAAITPGWGGNVVWFLAAGAAIYFAFPRLYAAIFSGFYLPLMMILWLFVLRGIGVAIRMNVRNPASQNFFDVVFTGCSILLAVVLGVGIGNVVRG